VSFRSEALADGNIDDHEDRLWTYIRASGALLQAHIHQLLQHEKEVLQLIGRRISEKLSTSEAPATRNTPPQRKCQILVADDHGKFRKALRILLAGYEDVEVMGEACNGRQAVLLTEAFQPDVVVMDINMPKMNGITATALIKRHRPETIVIGLSFYGDPNFKKAFLHAGASALIPKQDAGEQLYPAITAYWQQRSQEQRPL